MGDLLDLMAYFLSIKLVNSFLSIFSISPLPQFSRFSRFLPFCQFCQFWCMKLEFLAFELLKSIFLLFSASIFLVFVKFVIINGFDMLMSFKSMADLCCLTADKLLC